MKLYRNNITNERTTKAAQAMEWHRAGDVVTVGHNYNPDLDMILGRVVTIAGAARPERNAEKENRAHCEHIALEVEAYADGCVYRCPECNETIHLPADVGDKYRCPDCGTIHAVEDLEQLSLWDYMSDILDMEYRVGSDREYRSCRIMVAFGGPNIYIDTDSRSVELYWWNERASCFLSSDACDAIDEWMEEYWNI